ncbi:TetR/AcrR family transcriptional regulator [Nocardioides limicola]|uniref:TetR/AcrR family transcriptional regulator n=1 Tax=Nocardioides limicola TaxID=2803368 RepID=UPI00193C81C5|nr:TetR/AcrR family transcriptional regulator [Nocardioides sp. DJM-14]
MARMTAAERREQLIGVARGRFAELGYDGTSVEEIAAVADVSKPVVYEHFGGKEGLYAVVVDREVNELLAAVRIALVGGSSRTLLEQAAVALLGYIESSPDGFRILVRDRSPGGEGSYLSILGDVASRVEGILVDQFERRGLEPDTAPLYAQMLVGMVSSAGQWWLESQQPGREEVAAHLVNLAWYGLSGLHASPTLHTGH